MRTYLPSDGAAPALVTYERRPFASTSGEPSSRTIGSRPSGKREFPVKVSVQQTAAGSRSRAARCASLPTKSSLFTFHQAMSASTTS